MPLLLLTFSRCRRLVHSIATTAMDPFPCAARTTGSGREASCRAALPAGLPGLASDFGLLGHLERVVDLVAEAPHDAFGLRMTEEQLHSSQAPGSPMDQRGLVRRIECVPYPAGSRPISLTQPSTMRAYAACRGAATHAVGWEQMRALESFPREAHTPQTLTKRRPRGSKP
jgi:hypothetical protein